MMCVSREQSLQSQSEFSLDTFIQFWSEYMDCVEGSKSIFIFFFFRKEKNEIKPMGVKFW